jgi:hypothetical protein
MKLVSHLNPAERHGHCELRFGAEPNEIGVSTREKELLQSGEREHKLADGLLRRIQATHASKEEPLRALL